MELKIFQQLIFLAIFTTTSCLRYRPTELSPVIEIKKWLEVGEMEWSRSKDGQELNSDLFLVSNGSYVISPYVGSLILTCTANYPIQWKSNIVSHFPQRGMYLLKGMYSRKVVNMFDESTFTFSTDLQFQGGTIELTGDYRCEKVGNEKQSSSIYMFWEGTTHSLILSGKTVTVEVTGEEDLLEIPCHVSDPTVEVFLFKSTPDLFYIDHFRKLEMDSSTSYNPRRGFIISTKNKNSEFPFGKYKCVTNNTSDMVLVQVVKKEPGKSITHVDMLQPHAMVSFDEVTRAVTCCSSTRTAPALSIHLCRDPIVCKLFKESILLKTDKKITPSVIHIGSVWQEGSCSYSKLYPGLMGFFQCVGDGVDVIRNLYTSYPTENGTYSYYSSWENIHPVDLILITANENINYFGYQKRRGGRKGGRQSQAYSTSNRRPMNSAHILKISQLNKIPEKIFDGESINLTCRASRSYFAQGSAFVVKWKNGTLTPIDPNANPALQMARMNAISVGRIALSTVTIVLSTEMATVSCYAPVYNSTQWIQRELPLNVQSPILPVVTFEEENDVVYWTLNQTETVLTCKARGDPQPVVTMFLNEKEIVNKSGFMVSKVNSTVVVRIKKVSYETHGDYTCAAFNLAGVTKRKITVIVEEPTHWGSIIGVLVVITILMVAIAAVGWKLNLKAKLLVRLRRNDSVS